MSSYVHPEVLVEVDWVQQNLDNPSVKLIEIDVDTDSYSNGHIPGAIAFNWQTQLQDQQRRDILSKSEFETLLSDAGVKPEDTVVLYGDNHNWFAAYGFWLFKMYGHEDVRLMNGGRLKWMSDPDRPVSTDRPGRVQSAYAVSSVNLEHRAMLGDVLKASHEGGFNLVDVRSPDEFSGRVIAPPGMNETAQRGGHIPGATNIPWASAVEEDGRFKSANELHRLYLEDKGLSVDSSTIAYCRIGERSSHTWFVLKYLLGCKNVKNYDGSWTEYGNLVGVPIEGSA